MDSDSKIDTKLFNYIAYNKASGKYDILDVLLKRQTFINSEVENTMTQNIDEMLRIKLLSKNNIIDGMDNLELTKKANTIPDAHINDMYRSIQESLASISVSSEVAHIEIKNFMNTFLNDEALSAKVTEYLQKEKGVTQFRDLKKLSEAELTIALRLINLGGEDMERTVKSIVSSFA